jgi:hypothetical protein
MMTDTKYNGYTNYETWNIVLWLYNDENIYNDLRHSIRAVIRADGDADDVKSVVTRLFATPDGASTPDGVWLDDKRIDWDEIRTILFDDFR